MLQTYDTLKRILGEKSAREIVRILVDYFDQYITTEEIQIIKI